MIYIDCFKTINVTKDAVSRGYLVFIRGVFANEARNDLTHLQHRFGAARSLSTDYSSFFVAGPREKGRERRLVIFDVSRKAD